MTGKIEGFFGFEIFDSGIFLLGRENKFFKVGVLGVFKTI